MPSKPNPPKRKPAPTKPPPPLPSDPCITRNSPGKGLGVFTTQPVVPGTILLRDKTMLKLARGKHDTSSSQLQNALTSLSPQEKSTFYNLHENHLPYSTREMRIYKSNCFGDAEASWLSLRFARVNHSCSPNAEITEIDSHEAKIVALKALRCGEEVLISYLSPLDDGVRGMRTRLLRETYGFQCQCVACGLHGEAAKLSDSRRALIRVLAHWQMGLQVEDLKPLNDVNGLDQTLQFESSPGPLGRSTRPLERPLSPKQRLTTNFLLAQLLTAEGLINYRLAQAWVQAAVALMGQMQDLKPFIIIPSARLVEEWLGFAKSVMRRVRVADSMDVVELERACGVLAGCGYMVVAREVVERSRGKEVFATVMGERGLRLGRSECGERVERWRREVGDGCV